MKKIGTSYAATFASSSIAKTGAYSACFALDTFAFAGGFACSTGGYTLDGA